MEKIFNTLIDSFIENKVGLAENFLSASLAQHLTENLKTLYSGHLLKNAGTGSLSKVDHGNLFRKDIIYWLDRSHNNATENNFFDLMDSFVIYLNATCYTGITDYEFHYTLYEKGSFYKRHKDQFRDNDSRKYSMIMYLNKDWQLSDGGELCIYHAHKTENISPVNGKIVFFESSALEHEVLLSNAPRMSITGWLKV